MIKVYKWRSIAIDDKAHTEHTGIEVWAPTETAFWDHFYERIGDESGQPEPGLYGCENTGGLIYYVYTGSEQEWEIAVKYGSAPLFD